MLLIAKDVYSGLIALSKNLSDFNAFCCETRVVEAPIQDILLNIIIPLPNKQWYPKELLMI